MSDHAARLALLDSLSRTGIQIEVGPFLVRVRSDLSRLREHLIELYPDYPMCASEANHFDIAVVATSGVRRWIRPQGTLHMNGEAPFFPLPASLAGGMLEWGMNWCIGRRAQRWLAIHAAVVERGGRALILPAPSGSGKSTLCAELAYSGWRLFSDEFALIDPRDGRLWPAPRPISLKERAIEIIHARHPDVVFGPPGRDVEEQLFVHAKAPSDAVRRAHEPARPGCIVIPRYVPSAPTTIEALPRALALIEIADQSFNYNHLGPGGYAALVELVRASRCYRLEYSDLDDVRPRLADLMAA